MTNLNVLIMSALLEKKINPKRFTDNRKSFSLRRLGEKLGISLMNICSFEKETKKHNITFNTIYSISPLNEIVHKV